jgi:hypothetical protein
MSSQADIQEKMHRFIDSIIEDLGGSGTPLTQMSILFLTHSIESQNIFFNLYKEYLDTTFKEDDDLYEESMKKFAKNSMLAYLEFIKLQRKNREKFKKLQSDIVKEYMESLQETLKYINNKISDSDAKN